MTKSMLQLPKTVTLLGVDVPVVPAELEPDAQGEPTWGDSYVEPTYDAGRIRIHTGQSQLSAEQTLFHECAHIVLGMSGWAAKLGEGDEEALVTVLEHVWRGLRAAGLAGSSERGVGKGSRPRSRGRRKTLS